MDAGGIGSGMNWVGYHLTAYLALQQLLHRARSGPCLRSSSSISPAKPSSPAIARRGGDLDELTDTDRENTRHLYELMYQVVAQLGGALQVIALDHADFEDQWFADSVVERWRGEQRSSRLDGDAAKPRPTRRHPKTMSRSPARHFTAAAPREQPGAVLPR